MAGGVRVACGQTAPDDGHPERNAELAVDVIAGPDAGLRAGPVRDRGVETLLAECDLSEARRKR